MRVPINLQMPLIMGSMTAGLVTASAVGWALARTAKTPAAMETIGNLNARIRSWWVMTVVFALTFLVGPAGSMLLFACLSFLALREYVTLIDTRRADHRTLLWAFFVFTPLQYWLWNQGWYGLAVIVIPVYAFVFVPIRLAMAGDTVNFLDRAARMQWGMLVCVYCISHAPALYKLNVRGYEKQNAKLLLFLVIVAQSSDVFQYVWGKLAGKRKIAPNLSPSKTWEGFVGGVVSAVALGTFLWPITPFNRLQAMLMALVVALMGFAGGLVMSAIKRDVGVKDFGSAIEGHGGVLDRMDSICFSAPLFFHLTRWMFAS